MHGQAQRKPEAMDPGGMNGFGFGQVVRSGRLDQPLEGNARTQHHRS